MVYGFARQSSGHLKIYSESGHGTSVKLYLPRAVEQTAPGRPPDAAEEVPLPRGSESILLVEDNPGMRRVATQVLGELGYTVHAAADSAEALALYDRGIAIDLLFTDLVMPGGITGRALALEIRRRQPDLPVVFTSGYAGSAMSHGGDALSTSSLLAKPYRRQDMVQRIRATLDAVARPRAPKGEPAHSEAIGTGIGTADAA